MQYIVQCPESQNIVFACTNFQESLDVIFTFANNSNHEPKSILTAED